MKITVGPSERALLYVDGQPREMFGPGEHSKLAWFGKWEVRTLSVLTPLVTLPDAELIAAHPALRAHFTAHKLSDTQRGLLFKDDNLVALLRPGVHVRLNDAPGYRVETVRLPSDMRLPDELRARVAQLPNAQQQVKIFPVPLGHRGLLTLDNALQPVLLDPGVYAFWIGTPDAKVEAVDTREQTLEVQGQELMTQDKVSLRLNLSARTQVTEPLRVATVQSNYKEALYREIQLALRMEVAALTLDELLAKKEELGAAIKLRVETACAAFGVAVMATGIRDIILPGEMRTIMNQVIEAEKRAAANLIARREETASTRNLMNTAKMLESNPTLMRLKELESAERIAEKIQHLSVYGGLDAFVHAILPKKGRATD